MKKRVSLSSTRPRTSCFSDHTPEVNDPDMLADAENRVRGPYHGHGKDHELRKQREGKQYCEESIFLKMNRIRDWYC